VNVTIPVDALDGEMDTATIVATSTGDALVSDSALVNTYVNPFFDIELTPAEDAKVGLPGAIVPYTLTLSNLGNALDVVTLAPSDNLWLVSLPAGPIDLLAGESVVVTVEVTIPADAVNQEFDFVTITATSTGGDVATSGLKTTAFVEETGYFLSLPLVFKNPAE
jgi:uncharacterized membrane protein